MNSEHISRRLSRLERQSGTGAVQRVFEVLASHHTAEEIDRFLQEQGIRCGDRDMVIVTRAISSDRSVAQLDGLPRMLFPNPAA